MKRVIDASIDVPDRRSLVDIGCGTGANLAEYSDWNDRTGIDTAEEAIEAARMDYPEINFIKGSAPDGLGDFELFSEIAAKAKPGASILITVPADPGLWSQHDVIFGHYRRYKAKRLLMITEGLPLEVRLLSYFNSRLYPLVRAVRKADELLGRSAG